MPEYKVYLAGPITGLTYDDSADWRVHVCRMLDSWRTEIYGYSPLRAKEYLRKEGVLSGHPDAYKEQVLSSAKGILTRDHWDVQTCDLLLVNLLGATTVSIGTVMEVGFAHAYRKPIVVAMEADNVHQHVMLNTAAGWIVDDLDFACELVKSILLPGLLPIGEH